MPDAAGARSDTFATGRRRGPRPEDLAPVEARRSDEDAGGGALRRGGASGAAVGGITCAAVAVLSGLGRDLVFIVVVLGAFVGAVIGVTCAVAVLLTLRLSGHWLPRRRRTARAAAAVVAALVAAAGTALVLVVAGAWDLSTGLVGGMGVVSGVLTVVDRRGSGAWD